MAGDNLGGVEREGGGGGVYSVWKKVLSLIPRLRGIVAVTSQHLSMTEKGEMSNLYSLSYYTVIRSRISLEADVFKANMFICLTD